MPASLLARASVAATALALALAGGVAMAAGRPSDTALALALAFVPYAGLLAWDPRLAPRDALRWAVAAAALAGLVLVAAPSPLSDDLHRYLWDGSVVAAHLDPYAHAPDAPELWALRDASWSRINNPEIRTIYPPVAQALFWVAHSIAHAPWSVKLLALLAHLATIPIVGRLAGARGGRAMLLYAVNPLALSESALGGHVDAAAGLCIAACVASLLANRPWRAALLAAAASGIKLVGLAVAPLVGLRDRRIAIVAVCLAVLPVIALTTSDGSGPAGLGQYARRWRGNEGLFVVVESAATSVLEEIGRRNDAAPGHVRVPELHALLVDVAGTSLDPRAGVTGEKKGVPDLVDFEVGWLASLLARAVVVGLVLALAIALVWRRTDPLVAARWVLLVGLLAAPQVHPWYLLWLLPLEIGLGKLTVVVWSAAVLVAYAPLDGWWASRLWVEAPSARMLEYALVLAVLGFESLAPRATPAAGLAPFALSAGRSSGMGT